MSRPPRIMSETGLYHIIFRGINRQDLFEEKADYEKMIDVLSLLKEEMHFEIYAYCLMTNHVHLFIKEKYLGDIKRIMHKLLTRYVVWYNYKYQRSGSLIGNRYKSEAIEDEQYYLTLIRYIHQNPVRAGMVRHAKNYHWSSYREYVVEENGIADRDFTLSMLSENMEEAIKEFEVFHDSNEEENFSISNTKVLTDNQLKRKLFKLTKGIEAEKISLLSKVERNQIIHNLREQGFTIGQLERITGISRGIITRASNVQKQARPQ